MNPKNKKILIDDVRKNQLLKFLLERNSVDHFKALIFTFIVCFFGNVSTANAVTTASISNARLGIVRNVSNDPCADIGIGGAAPGGALCAGMWNGLRYMVVPGGCTDTSCSGAGGTDSIQKAWANNSGTTAYNVVTGASSTTDGKSNTDVLVTNAPNYTDTDAAKWCSDMDYGGYTDWYLPAASSANDTNGEMKNVLYNNKVALGGFQNLTYWASTETNATQARFINFSSGNQLNTAKTQSALYVRCVRSY